ncbi:MAG: cupin [Syntrophobacteraceae bacterium CG2_30_61_12]|nr:MAG: cupin [Syntrophobacteraceae bacterium CG2_30_61_12]PIU31656.1 MAG: cupin domain-containing protein [Syntrophobacteraceae bacterium CG07_land_8_20_14_0_80_61_8]
MKVVHYSEPTARQFESEVVRGVSGRVLIGREDGADHFCMRLFELAAGGFTPRHRHDWEHEVFVHAGAGQVYRDGTWVAVAAGHAVFVPANEEHQFRNTGSEPLRFVCLIPAGPPEL